MGFNFGGAMRGLGAGLVNSGALMEEYNKRKFEEEQLRAKLDREEHMQRLQLQAQQANADRTFKLAQTQAEGENVYRSKMLENDASRIELQKQEMQASAAERAAAASERSANAKVRSEQAARETEIYNMKLQEIKDKDQAISETSKALYPDDPMKQKVWTSMQKGYIQVTGKEKIGSEVVSKSIDTATSIVSEIEDNDIPTEAKSLGIDTKGKSVSALRTKMIAITANQLAEQSSGGSSGGLLNIPSATEKTPSPTSTINFKSLREQALAGDSNAIAQIKSLASSPQYKNNSAVQQTLRDIENQYRQNSSDTDSSFFNVGNYAE